MDSLSASAASAASTKEHFDKKPENSGDSLNKEGTNQTNQTRQRVNQSLSQSSSQSSSQNLRGRNASCCCTSKTFYKVIFAVGVVFTLIGALALMGTMIQSAGAMTSFLNGVGNITTTCAQALGADSLTLSIFVAAIGAASIVGGAFGWDHEVRKTKKRTKPPKEITDIQESQVTASTASTTASQHLDSASTEPSSAS